jgi:beta-phosphoglucomutase-like phosphatase (HAD superfamily)
MPQPELVIFDCDGVLVDSEIIAARIEAELLREAGVRDRAGGFLSAALCGPDVSDIMLRIEKESQQLFQATLIDRSRKRWSIAAAAPRGARHRRRARGGDVGARTEALHLLEFPVTERLEAMLTRTQLLPFFEGTDLFVAATPRRQAEAGARRVPARRQRHGSRSRKTAS